MLGLTLQIFGEMKKGNSLNLDIANKTFTRRNPHRRNCHLFGKKRRMQSRQLDIEVFLHLNEGRTIANTARALEIAKSTVQRVRKRFPKQGEAGLVYRRGDNRETKGTDGFLGELYQVVEGNLTNYRHFQPTWTRELLAKVMKQRLARAITHIPLGLT